MELDEEIRERLRRARSVVAFTGAGMSAESGVPTFRDAQTGLWQRYDPADLATPEAFERDPGLVWRWYSWRRERVAAAAPHAGHRALAEWEQRVPAFVVATQNVDGLHQQAGSGRVLELHGNIHRNICSAERGVVTEPVPAGADDQPPRCPQCAAPVRPDVVWFGEALPEQAWQAAIRAAGEADVLLSIGTSGLVQPAASIPLMALEQGAAVIEINPEPTPITERVTVSFRGPAAELLPQLLAAVG
ncbi:NAD-dependent deacylase [Aquisalimonas lutea]|uniref:SIR2 family NAD-dependent protein deacylase n=1 Tax=Aquisalimonas lutea TaxID=1327750 RepID=UPI0025B3CEF7|nr:NAD-dependent deacylase [Aquisalimonas lutea]MDN3518981.1 NAD-dependent deacylase [Aquisalimonas lutea]